MGNPARQQTKRHGVKRPREAAAAPPSAESDSTQQPLSSSDHGMTNAVRATASDGAPTVKALTISKSAGETEEKLFKDPIYRIMHRLPRSDVLEVVRCKFAPQHCTRAAEYFDAAFMQNPLRRLKLQIGCDGPGGLYLFFPRISFHRYALRVLDLSRNNLTSDDVVTLCEALALTPASKRGPKGSPAPLPCSSPDSVLPASHTASVLELLDLSYNLNIGNTGALFLLSALQRNTTIRAVQLVSVSIDDEGAIALAPLLRSRPFPPCARADAALSSLPQRPYSFFLNLNHNVIGAAGTVVLGKGLPHYVSVTLCKQRLKRVKSKRH